MDLQKSKKILKARCSTYTDQLILAGMNTDQQRSALAGSISTMYASLNRRGFFSTDPNPTYLPATQAEIDALEGYKKMWIGAAKLREIQKAVDAQIDALTDTSTFDVINTYNTILTTV